MDSNVIKRLPTFIGGLFSVITGILFVCFPEIISNVIGILFGVVLFVAGLSEVISYIISINQFRKENYGKAAGAEIVLVYSVIIMIVGLVFVAKHDMFLQLITFIFGLFFLIDGIVKLRQEIFFFKIKDIHSWALLILAVALIVAGFFLLFKHFAGTRNIIVFSGCAFIVSGIENCFIGVIKRIEKKTRKD